MCHQHPERAFFAFGIQMENSFIRNSQTPHTPRRNLQRGLAPAMPVFRAHAQAAPGRYRGAGGDRELELIILFPRARGASRAEARA